MYIYCRQISIHLAFCLSMGLHLLVDSTGATLSLLMLVLHLLCKIPTHTIKIFYSPPNDVVLSSHTKPEGRE